jgi:hypothetical protein
MKRQIIALLVILAIGLQGSVSALASAAMQYDCTTAAVSQSDHPQKSCCPSGQHSPSCCLDACVIAVGISASPAFSIWHGLTAQTLQFRLMTFSSRGDSPLIRPPIL